MPRLVSFAARAAWLVACTALASAASAPGFPSRPLKLMVGYPTGGGVDITARHLAEALRDELGQPLLVDNRAGASGMLAALAVAKAAPDGHTLLLAASGEIAANPHLYKRKMQYDAQKDLLPVTNVVMMPNVPAVAETPSMAGYQLVNWYGLFAPAGTPPEVMERLNTEVTKVLRKPEFVARMRALGGEADPMSQTQFRDFVQSESINFKRIIDEARVTLPE